MVDSTILCIDFDIYWKLSKILEEGVTMKMIKKIKMDMWINVFMLLLIGIVFVVRPQDSLEVAAMIAGAVILANGIFDLIYYFRVWVDFYSRGSLFEGIMKCVLGIFIITHAGITTVLFSYVFSIYIIINGIICIETAIYMQRAFEVNCIKDVILSCFVVVGGIIMMFFSPNTVKLAAIMTGIIFIINAVIDGVILYRIHRISRKCAEKLQDAVDELSGNIIDE